MTRSPGICSSSGRRGDQIKCCGLTATRCASSPNAWSGAASSGRSPAMERFTLLRLSCPCFLRINWKHPKRTDALESAYNPCKVRIWDTSLAHENARLRALLQTQQDTIRQMAEYNRLLSQRVAAYASEINRLKALVAKLQRMQFGKSSEKLRAKTQRTDRKHRSESAQLQEEMAETLGEQYDPALHPPCASLLPVNRYRPHFPVKPGLSGRKRNAVLPVVVKLSSLGCDVSEQLELISSAFKVIETQRPKNWPVAGATISCRHQYLQDPLHAVMPERGFWPMLSPGNMQTICRYTASQKYTVVREWS